MMKGDVINRSFEPIGKVLSYLPHDLHYEKVAFFPDLCPGKSLLPTGVAVCTKQEDWRNYVLSDIGCGMLLAESDIDLENFCTSNWDRLCCLVGKSMLLGSGNHFLSAFWSEAKERMFFVIHTGSRLEGAGIEKYLDQPDRFDQEYAGVLKWAKENRMAIFEILQKVFGKMNLVLDHAHNSFEKTDDGVIIRKGTVKAEIGDLSIIPSSMAGEMVLVKVTAGVKDCLESISHGTGRIMGRGEAKEFARSYDYSLLRKTIYIPNQISNDSIKTEAPFCYRDLEKCLSLLDGLIEEVDRFVPVAYIGQV